MTTETASKPCPQCKSGETTPIQPSPLMEALLLAGSLLFTHLAHQRWRCKACGHEWREG